MDFNDLADGPATKSGRRSPRRARRRPEHQTITAQCQGTPATTDVKWFRFPWEFEPAKAPRLVKGLMAHGDEVLVYGPPEAGKTFFLVDLSCRWACGEPWRGRDVERGLVIYLAGERKLSVQNRIRAWALRNGKRLEDRAVLVLDRPLNLLRPDDAEREAMAAEIQAARRRRLPVAAIVSDTVHSPVARLEGGRPQLRRAPRPGAAAAGRDRPARADRAHLLPPHWQGRGSRPARRQCAPGRHEPVHRHQRAAGEVPPGRGGQEQRPRRPAPHRAVRDRGCHHRPRADGEPIKFGVHVAIPITEVPNPPKTN